MKIIFFGTGDCEDTSVLCAALFEEAGFNAAVGLVPGHALASIAIDGYVGPQTSVQGLSVLSQAIDGKEYYGCETTCDRITYGIGLTDEKTIVSGRREVVIADCIGETTKYGTYGFYTVPDS